MVLKAVEPRRLYREVAQRIRMYIEEQGLPVGARLLTERELSEQLEVSRPTVREALIALEVEGRVRIRVGSGIYVAEAPADATRALQEIDGPFEILRARAVIEGAVATEAALLIRAEHIAILDRTIHAMERMADPGKEAARLDRAFHVGIAAVLGNSVIERVVGDLFDQRMTPYFGRLAEHFEDAQSWRDAVHEHRAIRDALVARDASVACEALRRHLECSQVRFSRSFGEGDLPADPKEGGLPPPIRRASARSL